MTFSSSAQLLFATVGAATAFGAASLVNVHSAEAAIINGSFNSGLSGWSSLGSVDASSGAAVLNAGSQNTTSVESFLGLSPGTLAGINPNPTFGSAIKQSFFAEAGTKISFNWTFNTADYLPYNDFAFYSLAPVGANLLSNVAQVGNYGSSGLKSLSFLIPNTGIYTLGFGVFNSTDNSVNSTLSVDNVTSVPTPALLPGLIGLGVGVVRKRKSQKSAEA